jgi:hypothetical protein
MPPGLYVPGSQARQLDAPASVEYWPAGQPEHADPACCRNPARHRHPASPLPASEVELAGHGRHRLEPAGLYVPAEQLPQDPALLALNVPARQA